MKKVIVLALIISASLHIVPVCGASTAVTGSGSSGAYFNKSASYSKSLLHGSEGVKGNYQTSKSQTSTGYVSPSDAKSSSVKKQSGTSGGTSTPVTGVYPTTKYIPAYYTYGWSTSSKNSGTSEINVQNNTYNYYNATDSTSSSASKSSSSQEEKTSSKTKSEESALEAERAALKKKFSNILSNKTMSNEKMCSKMESYYTNASYEELDHVLNEVLNLNCDIDKLRPDSVIK